MVDKYRHSKIVIVMLCVGALPALLLGITAGLCQDWMRMILLLFVTVLMVFYATTSLLGVRLRDHCARLEARFPGDRKPVSARVCRAQNGVGLFMAISVALYMTLSIIAGLRGNWFRLGVYLTACAITVIVCTGALLVLDAGVRLARLEKSLDDEAADPVQLPPGST